eukprot:6999883-Pyramimonas_sp.AAC.1
MHDQGEYEAARPLLEKVLAAREEALGPNHPKPLTRYVSSYASPSCPVPPYCPVRTPVYDGLGGS